MDLNGRKALVTGGSRGIGKAIALKLAEAGADVAINYLRQREPAAETLAAIEGFGVRGLLAKANVAEEEGLAHIFERIEEHFGGVDILVSNAASGVLRSFRDLSLRHFQWTLSINAMSLLPLAQRAMPYMEERGWGRIVAVSSLGATRAIPNYTAVGASKAALESIVRHLAIETAGRNINVNTVSAGIVDTDALKHFPNREELLSKALERTPAGRLTEPRDVADVVNFLCSEQASMIHGQTITVDGGYSIMG
jgi:enoyl-[acyl-carrier protein] reductase III